MIGVTITSGRSSPTVAFKDGPLSFAAVRLPVRPGQDEARERRLKVRLQGEISGPELDRVLAEPLPTHAFPAADLSIELSYNPASQITSRTLSNDSYAAPAQAAHSLAYQVNGLNQYIAASNRVYGYDPNGNLTSDGTTNYLYDVENRLAGQTWIPELGMYYYKARIYSPTLGRFLQTDPIGYEDQINLYAYVGNDPINRSDPTGTVQCDTAKNSNCTQVHQAAAEARSLAQSTSANLRNLVATVKSGNDLTADQQSLMAAFERKFGTASVSALNRVAGNLDRIADKIGVEGSGARINFGKAKGGEIASARIGGNSITIRPMFFGSIGMSKASVIFHEGGHLGGLHDRVMPAGAPPSFGRRWDGKMHGYGVSATDWLGAHDPSLARKNNDNYHCFVIPACGGP